MQDPKAGRMEQKDECSRLQIFMCEMLQETERQAQMHETILHDKVTALVQCVKTICSQPETDVDQASDTGAFDA